MAVAGSDARFTVRRIFRVGRNYAALAREMGRDPDLEPPLFFTRPADAPVDDGATIPCLPETQNLYDEAGMAVATGTGGADIDLSIYPRTERIFDSCQALEAFSRAAPMQQPDTAR